jgi:hypothetical protein
MKQQLERAAAENLEANKQLDIKEQELTRKDRELQGLRARANNAEALLDEISRTLKRSTPSAL